MGAPTRVELHADEGWQDRRQGLIRPVLPADQRRNSAAVRPRHATGPADDSVLPSRAVELGRHQWRRVNRYARDPQRRAKSPRPDANPRGDGDERSIMDAQRCGRPQESVHRPPDSELPEGDRPEHDLQRVLYP